MTFFQFKKIAVLLIAATLVGFSLLNCSVEPKDKPKSLVESQKKVLEGAKAIEAQLKEAEEKRRKEMDSQ